MGELFETLITGRLNRGWWPLNRGTTVFAFLFHVVIL